MVECIQCHDEKPATDFYAHKEMAAGHVNVCKECHKARMKARSRTNPRVQEYDRERAKLPSRKQRRTANSKQWRAKNPLAYKAHTEVNKAVRKGILIRLPCEFCGDTNVHGHHKDYSKPLDVIWLCAKCHNRLHAAFPELEGQNKSTA